MQAAFRENHGLQCGFCTPGMIMTAIDMIHRHGGQLDEATVRHELEGNICRCTGYHNIVKAMLDAAGPHEGRAGGRIAPTDDRSSARFEFKTASFDGNGGTIELRQGEQAMGVEGIGARVVRKEDKRFITGKGRYVDDIELAGHDPRPFHPQPARAREDQEHRFVGGDEDARRHRRADRHRSSSTTRSAI